ncbi:hypothetical protein JKF63_00539 [Porcisia hertigi]|uniref:Protein kinase domain-containing protein n=1 Tax=Porcisia hertigi TaxID=2761500 RepID=A0A836HFA4_9TRYP|nr:hypothetical protein JKF63_00539 [Porcisia hertigi]
MSLQRHALMRLRTREDSRLCASPGPSVQDVTQICTPLLETVSNFAREEENEEEPYVKRQHAEPACRREPDKGSSSVVRGTAAKAIAIDVPLYCISTPSSGGEPLSAAGRPISSARCPVVAAAVATRGARVGPPGSSALRNLNGGETASSLAAACAHPVGHFTATAGLCSALSGAASPPLSTSSSSPVSACLGSDLVSASSQPSLVSAVPVATPGLSMRLPVSSTSHRIHQHELSPADFCREEVLGEGSYSIVTLATHRTSGLLFALKEIDRNRLRWRPLEAQLRWEINLQRTLRHPHIVRLYSYFITSDSISLVLEYCSGGTLLSRLRAAPQHRFSEKQASRYIRHVAKALVHLHGLGVAHRDLKLENVLVDADDIAKLADFGWSRPVVQSLSTTRPVAAAQIPGDGNDVRVDGELTEEETEGRRTVCGTLDYLSPEMVSGQAHSSKTDVWSLGVMLAEMLTGTPPFYCDSVQQTLHAIQQLPPNLTGSKFVHRGPGLTSKTNSVTDSASTTPNDFVTLTDGVLALIHAMLQKDPVARPTMSEVVRHPWLQKKNF